MPDPMPSARPDRSAVSVAHRSHWLIAYPRELREAEARLISRRRAIQCIQNTDTNKPGAGVVGLALSGGGIRSATFSLGVLQAMARRRLLGRVDLLSTVSGGGYIGSFWAAWIARLAAAAGKDEPAADAARAAFDDAQRKLGDPASDEVRWLRDNGRYLSPNGAGDLLTGFAVHLRNWISIHVVMGSLLLALFLLLGLVPAIARALPWIEGRVSSFEAAGALCIVWSPWFVIGALPAVAALVFFGGIYWLPFLNAKAVYRNRVSRALTTTLVVTFVMLALAMTDSLGLTVCGRLSESDQPGLKLLAFLAGAGSSASIIIAGAKQILSILGDKTDASRLSIPSGLLAGAVALLLAALSMVVWSTAAHLIMRAAWLEDSLPRQLAACAIALAVAFAFGRGYSFINFSSLATIYAARLSRAYLGGTNPTRRARNNFRVTETVEGDDVSFSDYNPHEAGGPLHIVNVTLNETIKENARIEHRDSKGVPIAVGPAGISLGVRHHALWTPHRGRARGAIRATEATGDAFHCFAEKFPVGGSPSPAAAEPLTLGAWVSISGAAFTTGLGTRTSAGLSFLLGFFNVRLGYWWNCGVNPARRPASHSAGARAIAARLFYLVFPTQSLLLDEMMGRFRGVTRERLYLSDGGHFENTAAYELIRRRARLIVICDNGCDPGATFGDLGHLVRKARADFQAEIRPVSGEELKELLRAELAGVIGTLDDLRPDPSTGRARKHVALFWIHYDGGDRPGSLIVLLKPTMTGDEPVDLLNYRCENPTFPQQTTMDQFFDEAQWESYRKLGEVIGEQVFALADPEKGECFGGIAGFP